MNKMRVVLVLSMMAITYSSLTQRAVATTARGIVAINQSNIPYTIRSSGSYKLTTDLRVSDTSTSAITVNAQDSPST